MRDVSICFVFFRTTTLDHLDAAWYSVSRQDFSRVNSVFFLDNNTDYSQDEIQLVLSRYDIPVPLWLCFDKHKEPSRTQSWSVNRVCHAAHGPWLFFSRSDFILHESALELSCNSRINDASLFITGWCAQMACDAQLSNTDVLVDIEQYGWRTNGFDALLHHPFIVHFGQTNLDAGVWLAKKESLAQAGWMNEGLVSWGYQQSAFQRQLRNVGVQNILIPKYLFAHQHHAAPRDLSQANAEYSRFGSGQ